MRPKIAGENKEAKIQSTRKCETSCVILPERPNVEPAQQRAACRAAKRIPARNDVKPIDVLAENSAAVQQAAKPS